MSSAYPVKQSSKPTPKFTSPDKGLEMALNTLAALATNQPPPEISVAGGSGYSDHARGAVVFKPKNTLREYNPADPWMPVFTWNQSGQPVVYFNLGTINNVAPRNHTAVHSITQNQLYYIVAKVMTNNGKISSVILSLNSTPPEDKVNKKTPPLIIDILLGMIKDGQVYMIHTKNINLLAQEAFRESKSSINFGEEPYVRWYRWYAQPS